MVLVVMDALARLKNNKINKKAIQIDMNPKIWGLFHIRIVFILF